MRYIPTIATTATLPFKDRNCSPSTPSHRPQHATDTSAQSAKLHHNGVHNQFPTVLRTGRAPRGSCARRRSAQEVGNQEKTAREAAARPAGHAPGPPRTIWTQWSLTTNRPPSSTVMNGMAWSRSPSAAEALLAPAPARVPLSAMTRQITPRSGRFGPSASGAPRFLACRLCPPPPPASSGRSRLLAQRDVVCRKLRGPWRAFEPCGSCGWLTQSPMSS